MTLIIQNSTENKKEFYWNSENINQLWFSCKVCVFVCVCPQFISLQQIRAEEICVIFSTWSRNSFQAKNNQMSHEF